MIFIRKILKGKKVVRGLKTSEIALIRVKK